MDKKDKQIEDLKKKLENANEMWTMWFQKSKELEAELVRFKNLCKVQSDVINGK